MKLPERPGPLVARCSATSLAAVWLVSALAVGATLALAAPHDLAVTRALARPGGTFGYLVARFGEWPGIAAVTASLVLTVMARRRQALRPHVPVAVALMALATLHPLALTQLLKLLWGRVRPDALGAGVASYTPFYQPAGIGAGRSFPSGHVAISSVFWVLPFELLGRRRGALLSAVAWLLAAGYPALVAAGRIVERRHFLCDTLFSLLTAALLAPLLLRWAHGRRARAEATSR